MQKEPYIELKHIHKTFPGVYALRDVSLSVYPGEVHGLVGENGAGKSTLIKVIAGHYRPNGGEYLIRGKRVDIQTPHDAIRAGVAVVYQELNVVDSLSVAENVFFGRLPGTAWGRVCWKQLYEDTEKVLERLGLDISPRQKVGYLSVAQKQLVEIARAISMNPQVVIMDEPTSALAPAEIEKLMGIVERLRQQQVGIVYISHKLDEILRICDRVTILRDGEFVRCAGRREIDEGSLVRAMVGRKLDEIYKRENCAKEDMALVIENLTTDTVKDISLYVKKGEIVGFSGLMGAGRTELAQAIYGRDKRIRGKITICGKTLPPHSVVSAVRMGMGLIPEERKTEGIFQNLSVEENTTISSLERCAFHGIIQRAKEGEIADGMIRSLRVKASSRDQMIVNLSGGNQQKVLIARWVAKNNLKVLIVDEPTRGIDVGAKAEIYALLDELARQGLAVLVMSSEMQEILGVCDRIYVVRKGRITGEYAGREATQEKLLSSAI